MIGMSGGEEKYERSPWQKPILESKAINDLAPIACSKRYRDWNRKFKNAFEQTRPKSRKALTFLEALTEAEIESNFSPPATTPNLTVYWNYIMINSLENTAGWRQHWRT